MCTELLGRAHICKTIAYHRNLLGKHLLRIALILETSSSPVLFCYLKEELDIANDVGGTALPRIEPSRARFRAVAFS
ncbi:hypothetical protein CCR75_000087 [Bremia lactucae]|uniref:Uncharacterized protein n=1 Tax=Bremia lactucae TaxID=4779 RepID=A0A976FJJ3_BRELC|nr:hypothetical protein CCR75_000087 [Bremia lactucae]